MRNSKGQFLKNTEPYNKGGALTNTGRICASCKEDKELSQFGKNSQRFNGIHVYCKACCKQKRQNYKWYHKEYMSHYYNENKETLLQKNKNRYEKNKHQYLARQKSYYKKNKNKVIETNKKWVEKNKEKSNAIKSAWKKKNPKINRHHDALRRLRLKNQVPQDTDLKAIKKFYQNRPDGMEVDHIIPVSRGGLHTIKNLQYLSPEANRRKHNKLPEELSRFSAA